jgi:hypothetical protein
MISPVTSTATDRSRPTSPAASPPTRAAPGTAWSPTNSATSSTTATPSTGHPQDLQDHVTARDRECTGIGCHRKAHRTELDHIIPFSHGGHTSADNLAPECRREHHLNHNAGWHTTRNPDDGSTTWTTPTGRTYTKPAAQYPIDHTRPGLEPDDEPPF